jgi:outer membrane protein assembly factor BamB
LTDDLVIVHVGTKEKGSIIAFNLASGEPKWKTDTESPASSSPVIATLAGIRQIVTLSAKSLMGLDLADGKPLWSMPFESNRGNCTTPVIDGSNVMLTGEKKGLICAKIEAQDKKFAGTGIWTNMPLVSRMTTPVVRDGLVFGNNGQFFCAKAQTGEALWTSSTVASGNYASVLDCGAVMMGLTLKGDLVAYKPSDKEYSELARYKVSQKEIWAHPVISGKRIFIRDTDTVTLWTIE